jgi:hypothetical protein
MSGIQQTPANAFLRLPYLFDVGLLQRDLETCLAMDWAKHVNTRDYSGEWTGIALRSDSGEASDIVAHPTVHGYRDTALFDRCEYFRHVLQQFECDTEAVRLLRLSAGSRINEHRDRGESYASGAFRLHVPIHTNPQVVFHIAGCILPMKNGECWYTNVDLPHSVANESAFDRIHLVVDCTRNSWSDELFRSAGYDFAEEARQRRVDPDTKRRMIEELRRINSDASRQLIETLMAQENA